MNRFGDIDCSFKRLPPVYGYHSEQIVTIEKALQPIESQIDELPRYVKIAKRYCLYPSEHGLSKNQSAAIYIYTMEWGNTTLYRVLNNALRSENRQGLKIWFPYLKLFDSALDLLPTVKEVVWRGVPLDIGKNFTKNQLVTWWSVNSCSSSVNIIQKFLGNDKNSTLFLIEAINGKKISGYTEYENEDEIILRMGTYFRVKSDALKRSDGSHTVHLIEIDDDDDKTNVTSALNEMHLAAKPSNKGASKKVLSSMNINVDTRWKQNAVTIAGGNGQGNQLDQFSSPYGIYVDDDDQCIYIADEGNHRIVKWRFGAKSGQIVAGGSGPGNQTDELKEPTDVIVDKKNDSMIICDHGNKRVMRWSRRNERSGQVIISDIDCSNLTMDNNGDLYVSDREKNKVGRWKIGDTKAVTVAGGNGRGDHLNQLNGPSYIFVDEEYSVYVSDYGNHRVMKWMKGAQVGIVVAGGNGPGNNLTQLSCPYGVTVDHLSNVYIADCGNYRVIRWLKESKQGNVVVGGNGSGQKPNQFNSLTGLSFDGEGNLYIVDHANSRVQKFVIDSN